MRTPEEGFELVDVRTEWKDEARDFTPWLAGNLDLLGEVLGLNLELDQREEAVGPFSLDILAREADEGTIVAIENQLDWTDHSHLGQLLTYATGGGAHIAIWVAPEFRYEHAEALHSLNEWTSERIRFYGVKVEVVKRTGDSRTEPSFRKVVYPGCWNKGITRPSGETESPDARKYRQFFQPLISELPRKDFADKDIQYFDHTGRFFPSSFDKDTGYAVSFWKGGAWLSLHVRTWDSIERNNRIFDELEKAKPEIDESIDAEWVWYRHKPHSFFTISIRKDGWIDDPPEATRDWMLEQLPKLKEVLDPHLERVLKELQSEGPAGGEA